MNFTKWYKVKENSKILILGKNIKDVGEIKKDTFDYIYLNGTLENIDLETLKLIKSQLNKNGTLFIAVDNRIGVKYLVGDKTEHCEKIYDSIKESFNTGKLYTKREIDKIIKELGFKNYRYYYPLPNYDKPSVIFTDEHLPSKNNSKINYNVIYDKDSLIIQDEINLLKMFTKENQFVNFTNSYIVELSDNEINREILYYSFNSMRKDKYSLILRMSNEYVEKVAENEQASEHINNINRNVLLLKQLGFDIAEVNGENLVKSKLIEFPQLDEYIINLIEESDIEQAKEIIDNWYMYIQQKLLPDEDGIVRHGFIDMVFENTFYDSINNKFIFFDQEWYKENIPIKFIMYRAINNLYSHNPQIERQLPQIQLLEKYHIKNDEYKTQEEQIQKEVIDDKRQEFYSNQYKFMTSPEEIKRIMQDIQKLNNDNIELVKGIEELKGKIKHKDEIIEEKEKLLNEKLSNKIMRKIREKTKKG